MLYLNNWLVYFRDFLVVYHAIRTSLVLKLVHHVSACTSRNSSCLTWPQMILRNISSCVTLIISVCCTLLKLKLRALWYL
jgi:hypothetical protein